MTSCCFPAQWNGIWYLWREGESKALSGKVLDTGDGFLSNNKNIAKIAKLPYLKVFKLQSIPDIPGL